ncbi:MULTISPECIES: hypothetical protein [unclassified Mycobacterium]|uniref:hypothetical protein n=1 Tax=unclassified Mycobacterium TaxID=2642494 RepID=UPI000B2E6036|nr:MULTISPECIES: hypothetical protein [unclassified Mycobacterium]
MKKLGFTAVIASALATAVVGFAAPASAGIDHHIWVHQQHQSATVPQVDHSVHQSR